ncbi:Lrp/AsnC family transcriptional regulator [Natronosalvus rutilus]|uniref:Lrp/AsnC family transcriptional regulator n=1 Tax=Natronosalvus rutilus TaxID=2953753 RepID=A0A9E7N665_9EURY|nr:Lrp/AsnC family transcriptional regulator [Natronosalvus rutilus]UTF52275.1 Lrp/AsnC family transcriptional regulator [Natronosalvus rutilus]
MDDVDRGILHTLQQDARNTTTREIGEQVGVTASTVSNRLGQLEADGIITNYLATLSYDQAGFPLHISISGTAPIVEREALAKQALNIPGVVNVRELMAGQNNIRLEAVGRSNDDITRVVTDLSELGMSISDEVLIRNQYYHPLAFLDPEIEI